MLGLLALLGLGLASLGRVGARHPEAAVVTGPGGETIVIVGEPGRGGRRPSSRVHLVLSLRPVEVDATRSTLRLDDVERVIPADWPTVLIDRSGRLDAHPLSLDQMPGDLIDRLRAAPFEKVRAVLIRLDGSLERFFVS